MDIKFSKFLVVFDDLNIIIECYLFNKYLLSTSQYTEVNEMYKITTLLELMLKYIGIKYKQQKNRYYILY